LFEKNSTKRTTTSSEFTCLESPNVLLSCSFPSEFPLKNFFIAWPGAVLDIKRPLFDQNFELGECLVLCLRSQNDPIDKATPGLRRRTVFSDLSSNSNENRIFKNNYGVTPVSIASPRPAEEKVTDSSLRGYLLKVNNKNKWEKRWFVLENELLFYYKQATDGKPADVLDIKLYLLKEGEAKKKSYAWNLILSPNAKLGKSSTKRNYSLKTESAKERKKWMTALQRIMDMSASAHCPMPSPPPLLTTANPNFKVKKDRAEMLFGRPLELAVHNPDGSQIPALVVKCINYLDNDRVLSVEGLFRLSGSAMLIDKYVARFDKGEDVDLSTEQDPHTVTGILKYYFRELPEPLMTFPLYDLFTLGAGIIDKSLQLRFLHHLVNRLPPLHRSLLDYLFSFLVRVAANSDKNKMAPPNIATVFAPALLRRFDRDPMASMADSSKINAIVVVLIQDFDFMFRNKEIDLRLTTDETAAMCCLALQDYRPKSPDELSFQKDTTMRILVEDSSFPYCETKLGSFGKVPLSCVQVLSREESQEYARKRQLNQRRKRLMEENKEQQEELKTLTGEEDELLKEVEDLLVKKRRMELDFYMLRTVLISMLDRRVQIKNEEECYSKPMRNKVRSEEEKETREEVSLNDFPKLVEDFYKESEHHLKALDAVGSANDQFLTSLEMFLGAIPPAKKDKKEKHQKFRRTAQALKKLAKTEALARIQLSEMKNDILRDLLELQSVFKLTIKREWSANEENTYSRLSKALLPTMDPDTGNRIEELDS